MMTIRSKKISIFLSESILNVLASYRQNDKKDNEAGGILLGQVKDNNVFILKASSPNKFDKSRRCSFECSKEAAQIIIDYEFTNSDRKTIYLGEWHTHPEPIPSPSGIDIRMIKNQYFKNRLDEPFLILIIQGLKEIYVALFDGQNIEQINYTVLKD